MALTKEETRRAQMRLLAMGEKIAEVFDDGGIPYVIAFGTLLGAVRHEGFVPWDDDFDLFLFEEAYDDGIRLLRESLPSDMFVEDASSEPLYFHAWAHVKDLGTVAASEMYPHDSAYAHKGLSIDLYRAKELDCEEVPVFIEKENQRYLERRRAKQLISEDDYFARLASIGTNKWPELRVGDTRERVFVFDGPYRCRTCKVSDVLPRRRYRFEGKEFWGPANADAILRAIYGDYLTPPPLDQRLSHYSSIEFLPGFTSSEFDQQ